MGYAVKKAGIPFKAKIETSADFSGQEAGFSAFYIDDSTGAKVDISGSFTEDANAAGLYFSPGITIPAAGDYTLVINNVSAGMDNHPTPLVVTGADIDDVKTVVDSLTTTLANVESQVNTLDEATVNGIAQQVTDVETIVTNIKTLIDDQDGSTVNSVMEFVTQINDALANGGGALDVIGGYVDNLELMLEGKAYTDSNGVAVSEADSKGLADIYAAIEANGNAIADVDGDLGTAISTLAGNITTAKDEVIAEVTASKAAVLADIAAVKSVVDANSNTLENGTHGLAALKVLIDGLEADITAVSTEVGAVNNDDVIAILNNANYGLSNIRAEMNSRFDSVDAALSAIDGKIDNVAGTQGFRSFI